MELTPSNDVGIMKDVSLKIFNIPTGNVATYFPESNVLIHARPDQRSKTPGFKSIMVTIVQ